MPFLSETLYFNASLFNLIILLCFAFLTWRFWSDYRAGATGLNQALFLFFLSLTIDRGWSAIWAGCGAAGILDGYRLPLLISRDVILLLIIAAFGYVMLEIRNGKAKDDD